MEAAATTFAFRIVELAKNPPNNDDRKWLAFAHLILDDGARWPR
jgi:hypothetical protein